MGRFYPNRRTSGCRLGCPEVDPCARPRNNEGTESVSRVKLFTPVSRSAMSDFNRKVEERLRVSAKRSRKQRTDSRRRVRNCRLPEPRVVPAVRGQSTRLCALPLTSCQTGRLHGRGSEFRDRKFRGQETVTVRLPRLLLVAFASLVLLTGCGRHKQARVEVPPPPPPATEPQPHGAPPPAASTTAKPKRRLQQRKAHKTKSFQSPRTPSPFLPRRAKPVGMVRPTTTAPVRMARSTT
jgi:hypothetical protein